MKISMKKRKRKGDLSSIIIALVFVFICLIAIPLFKTFANSNADSANKSNTTYTTFADESNTASQSPSLMEPYK